jgi:hypothetical protein
MTAANGNGSGEAPLHDLDAWLEAEASKTPRIKLFGETFALPADIPFDEQLKAWRMSQELGDDAEVDPEILLVTLGKVVGAERVARWREENKIGGRTVGKVLKIVMDHVNGGDEGEAPAANRETRRAATRAGKGKGRTTSRKSSGTGRSSSRTSGASTGSTSTPNVE